jgi:4-hydroxy-2-oxoheptanedioate aldolase
MNDLEKRMVTILQDLRENHGVIGVKAEFEAEGTRLEEALRLKEVITKAGLELTIKVGGCEAIKDMFDARAIGVTHIVGPMIETPYALKKYLGATRISFPESERTSVKFLINVETIDGYNNFDRMLQLPTIKELSGVVLGRVDMTGSLGMSREDINHEKIFDIALNLFKKCRKNNLECVMGGGIAKEALPFIQKLTPDLLDRYETRKIIFNCREGLRRDPEKGILKAVGFELMWLKNKRDFYHMIFDEDKIRLEMLEKRYDRLIKEAGGMYE